MTKELKTGFHAFLCPDCPDERVKFGDYVFIGPPVLEKEQENYSGKSDKYRCPKCKKAFAICYQAFKIIQLEGV